MGNNYLDKNTKFVSNKYISLAPDSFDEYKNNSDSLKSIIESGNATNIGIVCKYGGGKSSFIRTFDKNNKCYKIANVSVANIVDEHFKEEKVESIIIKQLLYSKKASDLPDSRVKRIGQRPKLWKYLLTTISISISIIAFVLFSVFVAQPIGTSVLINWFGNNSRGFLLTEILLLVSGICSIVFGISLFLFNIKSFSLKFKDIEITKNNDDKETPFFKYLDELVYFFSKTKTRIVFFEDLDRIKEYSIFDKLHELNLILNSSVASKENKKIVFVYACADVVFKNKSDVKNKYFDFTFNLEPVLTKENCASIILNNRLFEPLKEWLADTLFIDRISIYFDEMRVLLSVYNDCLLYLKNLDELKLSRINPVEVFTLMTYRAIFSSEFQKLVEGESELDKAIDNIKKSQKTFRPFDYLLKDSTLLNGFVTDEKHRDFLSMIIRYGYLHSDFKDYILRTPASNSLSSDELDFLRNLNSNKYDKSSYFKKFDNIDRLYSRLGDNDFKDVHILNKYIINDYINNKFDSIKDANIQQAFLPVKEEDVDYVADFIISFLLGEREELKEAGDAYNQLFFIKISKFKTNLLKIILESDKFKDDIKMDLITDYIFALANNGPLFLAQERFNEGISFVENHKYFRYNLVFYDWTIQYFDKKFERICINEMQNPNDSLIKLLVVNNCLVLDKESIYSILKAYGQNKDAYLKGHYIFNSQSTSTLFNYCSKNIKSYVDVMITNKSNQVGINSLVSYCEAKVDNQLIETLLQKRDKNAPKIDLNPSLSPTAIVSGAVYDVFKQINLSTFSPTLNASISKYKDEIISSELLFSAVSSEIIDISIKQTIIKTLLCESNCNEDVLKKIALLKISLDDATIKKLLPLTKDDYTKVLIMCSCAVDKKNILLTYIPEINNSYKELVENKRARVTSDELELLPGFNEIKGALNLKVVKKKQYRTIKI